MNLPCGNNELVIIARILISNTTKTKCDVDGTNETCISEEVEKLQKKCNGEQSCIFRLSLSPKSQKEITQARIIYSCIPSELMEGTKFLKF